MLHYVHQLVVNCVCRLFGAEQVCTAVAILLLSQHTENGGHEIDQQSCREENQNNERVHIGHANLFTCPYIILLCEDLSTRVFL